MQTGIVARFDLAYGSGFILPDTGADATLVYINEAVLVGDRCNLLLPGQRVSFEVEQHQTDRVAKLIQVLS